MTTTDSSDVPPQAPPRLLRRSRNDRVAAGVAGGLGEYFGLDPVLFRVLFAVSAFFGGAGVLGYVLAWAAIPDQGTQRAAVDGWVAELRRRRIPVWLVAAVAGLILWCVAFSWWAPGPFFPVLVVVILLVVVFGHRAATPVPPPSAPAPPMPPVPTASAGDVSAPTVSLSKDDSADTSALPLAGESAASAPGAATPDWVSNARHWIDESRQASRERRRRAFPVRIGTLLTLVLTLLILGITDAVTGVRLPLYFWFTGAIVLTGLLLGVALRRTPWSMAPLLIPVLAGMIAFGNTGASLHDGMGQQTWSPTTAGELHDHYRLAFGQGTLDLRDLAAPSAPRQVDVTMAAGQVRVLLPDALDATVHANVRIGEIDVDGRDVADTDGGSIHRFGGYDIGHTVHPSAAAADSAAPITITIHLADGNITVEHH